MSTTTFHASTDGLEAFLAQHSRREIRDEGRAAAATPPDPVPGSMTGYQPSQASRRALVPLRPKGFRPTRRGAALVVAAVMLIADACWWWYHHG